MTHSVNSEAETARVISLSPEETRAFFDAKAQELLGISGDEFRRRWRAGYYDATADLPGNSDIIYLAMLGASGY